MKRPCDCITKDDNGNFYINSCDCQNSGDLTDAAMWCARMNEREGCVDTARDALIQKNLPYDEVIAAIRARGDD